MLTLRGEGICRQFIRKRKDSNVFYAVEKTDFELPPGTMTVLSGESGSGKSTLLHMLAGLLRPTEGKVLLGDHDLYSLDDKPLSVLRNRHIGLVPQGQTPLMALTVKENILLPRTLYRQKDESSGEDKERKAEELMEQTGIADLRDVLPKELSGGELRRMSIARALIMNPDVILADEPTGDLDDENTEIVLRLFKEQAREGKAVFLVTHDRDTFAYADRRFTMRSGKIEAVRDEA